VMGEDGEDEDDQAYGFRSDIQSAAWEEYLMTRSPSALAKYLEAGGEVDASVRGILIDILENRQKLNNRGGRNSWRDYVTFTEVNMLEIGLHPETSRSVSRTKACELYAQKTNQELRTVEKQYDRGRRIYSPDCDIFQKVESDHEK